jgi:hypothetical protein
MYLNKPKSKQQAQAGVPVGFIIVFCLVKVEKKNIRKTSGRGTHAKYDPDI